MIYGYARVSTDGQSVAAQVTASLEAAAVRVFRETASGAQTDRAQLRKLTPYQQREAKQRRAAGESAGAIDRSYGVDRRTIERMAEVEN